MKISIVKMKRGNFERAEAWCRLSGAYWELKLNDERLVISAEDIKALADMNSEKAEKSSRSTRGQAAH